MHSDAAQIVFMKFIVIGTSKTMDLCLACYALQLLAVSFIIIECFAKFSVHCLKKATEKQLAFTILLFLYIVLAHFWLLFSHMEVK